MSKIIWPQSTYWCEKIMKVTTLVLILQDWTDVVRVAGWGGWIILDQISRRGILPRKRRTLSSGFIICLEIGKIKVSMLSSSYKGRKNTNHKHIIWVAHNVITLLSIYLAGQKMLTLECKGKFWRIYEQI